MRHDDEWDWLRSFLTVDKMKELLGPQEYLGNPIDRFEIAGIKSVHFLLHDHLEGYVSNVFVTHGTNVLHSGYSTISHFDTLGKNAIEYLRAKTVDLPKKFLDRGRI